MANHPKNLRNLIIILGDQLNLDSLALEHFDPKKDLIWMAEVKEESTHVWSHKARITLFLSAMRHFKQALENLGYPVSYHSLTETQNSLSDELARTLKKLRPEKVIMVEAGDFRVEESLKKICSLEILEDVSFFASKERFRKYAEGKKSLRMEYFYREMRREHGILMDGENPVGGRWNFDKENRGSFGKKGPPQRKTFHCEVDDITKEVLELVEKTFPTHPGELTEFAWPVTELQAQKALDFFIEEYLPHFGKYQDALWKDEPFLFHSLLASSMNLKILSPRLVIKRAQAAFKKGHAPIQAVEGFIRQILGWREYVRGVYFMYMPEYINRNALKSKAPLPAFYWTGKTQANCLNEAIGQTLKYGYAHHIQRLMVTGLFGLLYGVDPKALHEWYLAVYIDAVEWVELPNTLGMSQYADFGVMASKPYIASGKYIQRMSNYCTGCYYDPGEVTGPRACPFTVFYWDFVRKHRPLLEGNPRLGMQVKNYLRFPEEKRKEMEKRASELRAKVLKSR